MLGLMAFRALTGASALAAVPIWVASDAYCTEMLFVQHLSLTSQAGTAGLPVYCRPDLFEAQAVTQHVTYWTVHALRDCDMFAMIGTSDQCFSFPKHLKLSHHPP